MIKKHFLKLPSSLKSIIWVLAWSVAFTTSMTCNKLLSKDISTFTVVFMRSLFGFAVFLPFLLKSGISSFKTSRLPLHFVRIFLTFASMICTYYAYANLPLATATSIGFTAPIFTTLLALFILKDKVSRTKWAAVILGYIGVLIITAPGKLYLNTAVLIALGANLLASSAIITVKKLSDTDDTITIMAYLNVLLILVSSVFAYLNWQTPSLPDIKLLMLIGISATISQFCYIQALKHGNPSTIAPFEYTRLVFAIPVGIILFQEMITWWTILGSLIIIVSNYHITWLEARKKKKSNTPS